MHLPLFSRRKLKKKTLKKKKENLHQIPDITHLPSSCTLQFPVGPSHTNKFVQKGEVEGQSTRENPPSDLAN